MSVRAQSAMGVGGGGSPALWAASRFRPGGRVFPTLVAVPPWACGRLLPTLAAFPPRGLLFCACGGAAALGLLPTLSAVPPLRLRLRCAGPRPRCRLSHRCACGGPIRCAGLSAAVTGLRGRHARLLRFTSGIPPPPTRPLPLSGWNSLVGGWPLWSTDGHHPVAEATRSSYGHHPTQWPELTHRADVAPTVFTHPQREGTGRRGGCARRKAKQSGMPAPQARHRTPTAPRSGPDNSARPAQRHRPRRKAQNSNPRGGKSRSSRFIVLE